MLICPHCNEPGIRPWAKYRASAADPAVCQICRENSCIRPSVETASTLLYVIAGMFAFASFFLSVADVRRGDPAGGPHPGVLLIYLLLFYAAVEAAKVYWAPLQPLSNTEVARKKSSANRTTVIVIATLIGLWLLDKFLR